MDTVSCSCSSRLELSRHALGGRLPVPSGTVAPAHHGRLPVRRDRADLIVLARISTGVPGAATAEAMAVSGGVITAIGSAADVAHLAGPDTTIITPDGFVSPGFVEPHAHVFTTLLWLDWVSVSHTTHPTIDDVMATLKDAAAKASPGDWVRAKQFDPSLYAGEPELTREMLDQVSTTSPVFVMNASGHLAYFNSAAMTAAGLTDSTPDPEGGFFLRADGRMTGVASESGAELAFIGAMPRPTQDDIVAGVRSILRSAASTGVTTFREAATGALQGPQEFHLLTALNASERLPCRVSTAQWGLTGGGTPEQAASAWAAAGVTPFCGDGMVRADAWKLVSDGSNQGRTGYFMQPYLGRNDGHHANFTPETLRDAMTAGLDAGWQLMVHTNGDGAIEMVLRAYEDLLPGHPHRDLRHRLEHCSFATPGQFARMAAVGASPSFLMNHVRFWGAAFRDTILGPERAGRLDSVRSALDAGLRASLHSDYDVTEIKPLSLAATAALRVMVANGEVLNPDECVSAEQALTGVTADAAWQVHADDRGTLEVGKRADWAVLSADPWSTDPHTWADITVHQTYIDGTVAYEA